MNQRTKQSVVQRLLTAPRSISTAWAKYPRASVYNLHEHKVGQQNIIILEGVALYPIDIIPRMLKIQITNLKHLNTTPLPETNTNSVFSRFLFFLHTSFILSNRTG